MVMTSTRYITLLLLTLLPDINEGDRILFGSKYCWIYSRILSSPDTHMKPTITRNPPPRDIHDGCIVKKK